MGPAIFIIGLCDGEWGFPARLAPRKLPVPVELPRSLGLESYIAYIWIWVIAITASMAPLPARADDWPLLNGSDGWCRLVMASVSKIGRNRWLWE